MRSKTLRSSIKAAVAQSGISLENDQFIKPAAPVEQLPTELPYAKEQDDFDETGVTMEPVVIEELYEELDEALADIALNITAVEGLEIVSKLSNKNLSNAAMEDFVRSTIGLESGTRLLASTVTGGIQCSADVISLEEVASNAAKAGWENINRKVTSLLTKVDSIAKVTDETGSRIVDQFRAVKKAAFAYKGGSKVNISTMAGGDQDLNTVIANTKTAILEDLSGRIAGQLDKTVNDLTKSATVSIAQRKGDLTSIVANGVKAADTLSNQYKIKQSEFKILGFTRKTLDDQLTLPQGIIGALSGNGRTYNYPRYSANKSGKRIEVELKPNTVKDLYSIGMNIGNEINDQARIWPQRLEALKSIAELSKHQASSVDADSNTWSAEQMAARNALKMWNANASARKHYINIYNKIASEILQVLNHITNTSGTPTTEAFGGFFQKKPVEVSKPPVPMNTVDLQKLIKSTAFPGFIENYTADIPAYNDNFKDHVAGLFKAGGEIGRTFNESSVNKYTDDVARLLDNCYMQYRNDNPDVTDWRTVGNETLELFTLELQKSKLLNKHFGMVKSGDVFVTHFDYAPNLEINRKLETRTLPNKHVLSRLVSGFTKDSVLQFFSVFDNTDEIALETRGLDSSSFLRENPRYDDAVAIIALEPLRMVTVGLFDIMDQTLHAIRDGLIK